MQNLQSPGDLFTNIYVLSEPSQGTQRTQENQKPGIETRLSTGVQSFAHTAMHQNEPNNEADQATQSTNQGDQSPGISTQLEGGTRSSAIHQNKETCALLIAGAILETGLNTLKGFADFIPMAPALGPALDIVCACIKVDHVGVFSKTERDELLKLTQNHQQVSENKEKTAQLLQELSTKIDDLKKFSERSVSTEMVEIFGTLAKYNPSLPIRHFNLT